MVWSVVEGLQGFEDAQRDSVYSAEENADESDYAYSRPISAIVSRNAARSEPLQLYIKGQDRSENGLQEGNRRKAAATGSERPETKVGIFSTISECNRANKSGVLLLVQQCCRSH